MRVLDEKDREHIVPLRYLPKYEMVDASTGVCRRDFPWHLSCLVHWTKNQTVGGETSALRTQPL